MLNKILLILFFSMIISILPTSSASNVEGPPDDIETIELKKQLAEISLDGRSENLELINLHTIDKFDNVLNIVAVDQTVNSIIDVINITNTTQNYALLIVTYDDYQFSHKWVEGQLEPNETFVYNHEWTLVEYNGEVVFAVSSNPIKKDLETGLVLSVKAIEVNYLVIDSKIPQWVIDINYGSVLADHYLDDYVLIKFKHWEDRKTIGPHIVLENLRGEHVLIKYSSADKLIERGYLKTWACMDTCWPCALGIDCAPCPPCAERDD